MWLAAAAAFNLICTGTVSHKDYFSEGSEPFSRVLRVDLGAGKYCEADCGALFDIHEVQPAMIRLRKEEIDTPRERRFLDVTVDRETGRYSGLSTSGLGRGIIIIEWEGKCERAAFSGFPNIQTKF